jgi:hypothetical protein
MKSIFDCQPVFIVGAAKCATTSLAATLANHTMVCRAIPKEVRYFSDQQLRKRTDYTDFFDVKEEHMFFLDVSPQYTSGELTNAPQNIYKSFPNGKIIYIVRDYFDRYLSWKVQLVEQGDRTEKNVSHILQEPYFVSSFLYSKWIEKYTSLFGSNNILALLYEDIRDNPKQAITEICCFLGIDNTFNKLEKENTTDTKVVAPIDSLVRLKRFMVRTELYWLVKPEHRKWAQKFFVKPLNKAKLTMLSDEEISLLIDIVSADNKKCMYLEDLGINSKWRSTVSHVGRFS